MARTSRKKASPNEIRLKVTRDIFNTALYIRLSVEDNGKEDSDSLENQRDLLDRFIAEHPELHVIDVYIDNGHTGTDFNRPEFDRMIADVKKAKIDCIVVKDFSRLGRNFAETGNYLERVFPFLGVRFISVNDAYDSSSATAGDQLALRLKNLVNDMYAKDISKKLCSTMKAKRERGEYIGNYAPYGYLKDENNHNKLVIDFQIAPIVIEIFELRAQGKGIEAICKILNEKGYLSPGRLRYERGIITNNNQKGSALLWNKHVLKDILTNVVYIGHLAQGRSAQCLYKGESFHWTKPEEWDYVENTHKPIISLELWEKVQEVNQRGSRKAKENHGKYAHLPKRVNPYGSVLVCADCGRVLKYVRSYSRPKKNGEMKDYYNFKCPNNIELGEQACSKKNIRADELDQIVLEIVKKQMDLFLAVKKDLDRLIAIARQKAKMQVSNRTVESIEEEISHARKMLTSLYTDHKEGILSLDEYQYGKAKFQEDIDNLERELQQLVTQKTKPTKVYVSKKKWEALIRQYYSATTVTPEMVTAFIKEIRFYANRDIEIKFNFMDEFEEMLKERERIKEEVA